MEHRPCYRKEQLWLVYHRVAPARGQLLQILLRDLQALGLEPSFLCDLPPDQRRMLRRAFSEHLPRPPRPLDFCRRVLGRISLHDASQDKIQDLLLVGLLLRAGRQDRSVRAEVLVREDFHLRATATLVTSPPPGISASAGIAQQHHMKGGEKPDMSALKVSHEQ